MGALRSGTSCVIDAAGPERLFFGVTVSRTWVTPVRLTEADQVVTPTRAAGQAVPRSGRWSATTTYVVASVAAFQVALTVKLSAGLVRVIARPVTGPGFTGGLASAGTAPSPTTSAVAVTAMAVMRAAKSTRQTCGHVKVPPGGATGERPPWPSGQTGRLVRPREVNPRN